MFSEIKCLEIINMKAEKRPSCKNWKTKLRKISQKVGR